jgi:tetratricopeptide (TPR) repeat protein
MTRRCSTTPPGSKSTPRAIWQKRTRGRSGATELQPREVAYLDTLASVERARGDLPKAEATLTQAPARSPFVHYRLGIVRAEQGARDKAIESFEQALKDGLSGEPAQDARERVVALRK